MMLRPQSAKAAIAIALLRIVTGVAASSPAAPILPSYLPSEDIARQNAFHIFNAVHSAMRQWGSSIKHNGLSFALVTVPEGQPFYHGTYEAERPEGYEWLAFEIEHAAQFGRSFMPPDSNVSRALLDGGKARLSSAPNSIDEALVLHGLSHEFPEATLHHKLPRIETTVNDQKRLGMTDDSAEARMRDDSDDDDDDDDEKPHPKPIFPHKGMRGFLQTYRASRPLKLLYIDGMAAAKFPLGSLDSQNYILCAESHKVPQDGGIGEFQRVDHMCKLLEAWALDGRRIDGFIRMETGFEVIYCHFEEGGGLDLVNVMGSPFANESGSLSAMGFEWVRAGASRYQGMPVGRAEVDFSSMVTAFAYPINVTNPDPSRPELPRLVNATKEDRLEILHRLQKVSQIRNSPAAKSVNWQSVVDMIVSRFADRLWYYNNTNISADFIFSDIGTILHPFIDFRDAEPIGSSALNRCIYHYLDPSLLRPDAFTPEDTAIYAAIETVSEHICTTLFDAHHVLAKSELSQRSTSHQDAVDEVRGLIHGLVEGLDWPTWKQCGRCENADEVCFVAMFPFGAPEDHFAPRCKNATLVMSSMEYFLNFKPWS